VIYLSTSSKAVKHTSKVIYNKNIMHSIVTGLVFLFSVYALYVACSLLSFTQIPFIADILFLILAVLVIIPLTMGIVRYYWRIICDVVDNPVCIFYYLSDFKLYKKALFLTFSLCFKAFLRALIIFAPALTVKLITQEFFYSFLKIPIPLWVGNFGPIFNGLVFLGIIALFFSMIRYGLTFALFVFDENMEVEEIMNMSNIISKKSSVDLIYLFASFIPLILLSLLIFPLIFTLPYFCIAYLIHARYAVTEFNSHIEKLQQNTSVDYFEGI